MREPNSNEVKCPHCGEIDECWNFNRNEVEGSWDNYECGSCGKTFRLIRNFDIWHEAELLDPEVK